MDLLHDREIFWPVGGPGDAEIPAIAYLGTGRRTWSPDLDADLAVVVLETAARRGLTREVPVDPANRAAAVALLDEGARSSDASVRWTATHLRKAHDL